MNIKHKYILSFSQETANKPITYQLIKNYDLMVNIINAEITAHKKSYLLIEISGKEQNLKTGIEFLENNNVQCQAFNKQLQFDDLNCISCGSCTGVCYSKALEMNKEDKKVHFNPSNCTACGICVKACPLQLLNLTFTGLN